MLFGLLAWALSLPLPRGRALLGSTVYGLLGFGLAYGLMYFALLEVSIGMAAVIMATLPLFTLVLAVLHGQERLTSAGVIGGSGRRRYCSDEPAFDRRRTVAPPSRRRGLCCCCRRRVSGRRKGFPRAHPVTTNAVGMTAGALLLWAGSSAHIGAVDRAHLARTWAALSWLVIAGSVGLFYLFVFVIGRWTASATAYSLTLMPVVAVTLAALLADEPITPEVVVGAALVVVAVYVGAIRRTADQ